MTKPARKRVPKGTPIRDRIRAWVEVDNAGCWIWQSVISVNGYAHIGTDGSTRSAHRVSYEAFVGPIPEGMVIDHLCRNRACVNPEHLKPVDQRSNVMRSPIALGAINAAKTHCAQGHPYDAGNTYVYARPGTTIRVCRTCSRARTRAYQLRKQNRSAVS
jgi:hypothetical protein